MASIARDQESDYDSSSSSITVPDSHRSWMSSRRSSISLSSETSLSNHKPHKANQASYQAMKRLQTSQNGKLTLEHFRLLRRLGSGDIGNVYLCQIRNPMVGLGQCYYAMKVVDREALAIRKKLQRAEMEKEILNMLDHPFLPTLYAEFDASHYSCLVMEFCPGGDLYAARQRLPGKRFHISSAKFYAAETILALEYLHMMGIVYRDLKPENVLVREDGHIMLSDFDLSFKCEVIPKLLRVKTTKPKSPSHALDPKEWCSTPVLSCFLATKHNNKATNTDELNDEEELDRELVAEPINARSKSFVGTHEYLAPEVISGQGHGSGVDWWTLGVFLYEMVYGKTPFKGENNEKTLINILKSPLGFPRIGVSSSKEIEEMMKFEDLVRKLLVKNPKKRIGSLKGSLEIKRHEFFKGVNWALIRSCKPPEIPSDPHRMKGRSLIQKLSRKERDAPYQIPQHFDYF